MKDDNLPKQIYKKNHTIKIYRNFSFDFSLNQASSPIFPLFENKNVLSPLSTKPPSKFE